MADMNDLQREWDSQPEYPEERMRQIAELVRTRSFSMRSRLFTRDMTETIAAVVIIIVFGVFWFSAPNAMSKIGIAITIAGAVEIVVLMQIVQRRGQADFASVPLREFLSSEVQLLNRQISLLRHVAWWYLLPLYTGACVFVIGMTGVKQRGFCIYFCVGYLAFCTFVWWLNQYARTKTLEPLRDALQNTLVGLSSTDMESWDSDSEIFEALANPALNAKRSGLLRFVRPAWYQMVLAILAGLGGLLAGVRAQQYSGAPMRLGEWPLLGLLVGTLFTLTIFCLRRIRDDD